MSFSLPIHREWWEGTWKAVRYMKAEFIKQKKTKRYQYMSILIADKKLFDYELVKVWNYGIDCKKSGSAISIMLRKTL